MDWQYVDTAAAVGARKDQLGVAVSAANFVVCLLPEHGGGGGGGAGCSCFNCSAVRL